MRVFDRLIVAALATAGFSFTCGARAAEAPLERVPIAWTHAIEKDSLKIEKLEHVLIEKPRRAFSGPTLAGCYERVYDGAHLSAHPRQLVTRATLLVKDPDPATKAALPDVVADGEFKLWVRRHKESFDSEGACRVEGEGLTCGGSLSAAEADTCKTKADGVRDCRVDPAESGSFHIAGKTEGVLVTIRERLELVPAPYDGGPFLNLSGNNAENHAFLLKSAPASACK